MINVWCMRTQEWLLRRNINGLLKCPDSLMNEELQVLLGKGDVDLNVKAGPSTVSEGLHR